jgi:hypothetical protein
MMKRDLRGVDHDEQSEVIQYHNNNDNDDDTQFITSPLLRGKKTTKMAPLISASIDSNHAAIRYNLKEINFNNSKKILDNNLLQKITDNQEFLKTAKKEKVLVRDRDINFLKGQIHELSRRKNAGSHILCDLLNVEVDPSMSFAAYIAMLEKIRKNLERSELPAPVIKKTKTLDLFDVARAVQGQQALGKGLKNQATNAYNILKETTHFPPRYDFLNHMNHPDRRRYDMVLTRALRRFDIDGKPAPPRAFSAPVKRNPILRDSDSYNPKVATKKQIAMDKAGYSLQNRKDWFEVADDGAAVASAPETVAPTPALIRPKSSEPAVRNNNTNKISFKKNSNGIKLDESNSKQKKTYYDIMNEQLESREAQPPVLVAAVAAVASPLSSYQVTTTRLLPGVPVDMPNSHPVRRHHPTIAAGVLWQRNVHNIFYPPPGVSAPEDSHRQHKLGDYHVSGLMSISSSFSCAIKELLIPIGFLTLLVNLFSSYFLSNKNQESFNYFVRHGLVGPVVEEYYKNNLTRSIVIGSVESVFNFDINNLIKHTLVSPYFIKNTLVRIIIHVVHNVLMLIIFHYRKGRRNYVDSDDFSQWVVDVVHGPPVVEIVVPVEEEENKNNEGVVKVLGKICDVQPQPTETTTTQSSDSNNDDVESISSDDEIYFDAKMMEDAIRLAHSATYKHLYRTEGDLRLKTTKFWLDVENRRIHIGSHYRRFDRGETLRNNEARNLENFIRTAINKRRSLDITSASDIDFYHLAGWLEFVQNNELSRGIWDRVHHDIMHIETLDSTEDKLSIKNYESLYHEVGNLLDDHVEQLTHDTKKNVDNILNYHKMFLGCSVRPSDIKVFVALRQELFDIENSKHKTMSITTILGEGLVLTFASFSPIAWNVCCWKRALPHNKPISRFWFVLGTLSSSRVADVIIQLHKKSATPVEYFRALSGIDSYNQICKILEDQQIAKFAFQRQNIVKLVFEQSPMDLCSISNIFYSPLFSLFNKNTLKNIFLFIASCFCCYNVVNHGVLSFVDAHEQPVSSILPPLLNNNNNQAIVTNVLGNRVVSNSLFGYLITYASDDVITFPNDPTDIREHFKFFIKNIFKKTITIINLNTFSTPIDVTNIATHDIRVQRHNLVVSGTRHVLTFNPPGYYSVPYESQLGYCNNAPMRVLSSECKKHLSSHVVGLNQQIHSNLNPTSQTATDSALFTLLTQSTSNDLNCDSHGTELSDSTTGITSQRSQIQVLSSNCSVNHQFSCVAALLRFLNNIPRTVAAPLCLQWLTEEIQAIAYTASGLVLLCSCRQLMSVSLLDSSPMSTKFSLYLNQLIHQFKNKLFSILLRHQQNQESTTKNSSKLCSVQLLFPNIARLLDSSPSLSLMILSWIRSVLLDLQQKILDAFKDPMKLSKLCFSCTTIASMIVSFQPNGLSRRQRSVIGLSSSLTCSANLQSQPVTTPLSKQHTEEFSPKQ